MSAREQMLRTLRAAAFDAALPDLPSPAPAGDVVDRFIDRARAAGTEVVRAEAEPVAALVARHAAAAGVRSLVAWEDEALRPLVAVLRQEGIEVVDRPETADAGLTTAEWALAETGTVVLAAAPGHPRSASLLPSRHLVVLPQDRILPTLFELIPRLRALPSALTFVTGPSRTADIELTPVRGAHGPVAVTVFITT